MNRIGQPWDPSVAVADDRDNTPARNREWYGRELNVLDAVNYILYTKRMVLDFYVPPGFLDLSRYEITAATLRLYCHNRIPNGAPATPDFDLRVFERGLSHSALLYNTPIGTDYTLYHSIDDGTVLADGTISGVDSWQEIDISNASFIGRIESVYKNRGHISIGLVDANETNYATSTEDAMAPGYDGTVIDRAYDYNDFTHGSFYMFNGDPDKLPELVLTYQPKDEAGTIHSMSLDLNRSKYSGSISGLINVSDPEEEDQTLVIEARYALPGGSYGEYVGIDTQVLSTPDPSGSNYVWTADISQPVQELNLIYSLENWLYDQDPVAVNANWTTITWLFTGAGSISQRWSAGRLKPNTTYTISAIATGSISLHVTSQGSDSGTSPSVTFNSGTGNIDISVTGTAGIQLTDLTLIEVDAINSHYYAAEFRAQCTEIGQSGNFFYPSGSILVDNRIPTSFVISEANSTDSVFQAITPSGSFAWTEADSPAGISGYYVAFSASKYQILSSGNAAFVGSSPRTYNAVAPTDGRWYLSVAPVTNAGLVGNTESYGFFYNEAESFVDASGLVVNGITLSPTTNSWIASSANPSFSWTPPASKPGNTYTYHLQCGYQGGVEKTIEHNVDWDLIDASATKAFFRLTIKDDAGVVYLTKRTDASLDNWEWYDGSWHAFDSPNDVGLLKSTGATKVRYTLQVGDGIPERISLHSYLEISWFDVDAGGIFNWSYPYDPGTYYFSANDRGYLLSAVVDESLDYTGKVDLKLGLKIGSNPEQFFFSSTNPVGFQYRETMSDEWRQIDVTGLDASGTNYFRINVEPYMNIPPATNFQLRWKFILDDEEEASWRDTLVDQNTVAPDSNIEWSLLDPEIDVSGLSSPGYIHGISLGKLSTTYYARVKVFDGFEYGDWSNVYKFKVNTPPSAPTSLRIV